MPKLPNPSIVPSSVLDSLNASCTDPTQERNSGIFFGFVQPKLDLLQFLWFPPMITLTFHSYSGFLTTHLLAQLLSRHGLVKETRKDGNCIHKFNQYILSSKYVPSIVQRAWNTMNNNNQKSPSDLLEHMF